MGEIRERIENSKALFAQWDSEMALRYHLAKEWRAGNLIPKDEHEAALAEAERKSLGARLAEYYEPHEIELWLTRPQPLLGHKTAVQIIAEGRENELHQLLDQLDSGAYL